MMGSIRMNHTEHLRFYEERPLQTLKVLSDNTFELRGVDNTFDFLPNVQKPREIDSLRYIGYNQLNRDQQIFEISL